MTEEEIRQKIKEILAKDKSFNDARVKIKFKSKERRKGKEQ